MFDRLQRAALALAAGAALFAGNALAQASLTDASSKALQDTGNFKVRERVAYLPTAQVQWMSYNKIKMVQHAGALSRATRSSYSSTEVNSPVEVDKLKPLAQALHDDLVAKLQAAGWQVVPGSDPAGAVPGLKPFATDAASGLPMATWNAGKYAVVTAGGAASADTQAPSTGMAQARFIKGKGGVVLLPTWRFDTASFSGERSIGYSDTNASTSANAQLLMGGSINVISDRGWFSSTVYQPVAVPGEVGSLAPLGSGGPSVSRGTRTFLGLADSSKSAFEFVPNGDKAYEQALEAGKALNDAFVARLQSKVK